MNDLTVVDGSVQRTGTRRRPLVRGDWHDAPLVDGYFAAVLEEV